MDKGGAKAERGYPGPTRGTGSERGRELDVQSGDSLRWEGLRTSEHRRLAVVVSDSDRKPMMLATAA